jgi:flavodoxin
VNKAIIESERRSKMKRAAVVYYSFDESTRALAEAIASAIGGDLLGLVPVGDSARTFYHHVENPEQIETSPEYNSSKEHVWGNESVKMNGTPVLESYDFDPSQYELIVIGSPVWAFTYAPPLRTFLEQTEIKGVKIALFCTHEGMIGSTFEDLKKALKGNEIIQEADFEEPASRLEEYVEIAKEWAEDLLEQ